MLYDIASKRLVQIDPKAFLSLILQRPISGCVEIEELPQEMRKLNRADQVWRSRFITEGGEDQCIILIDFVTHWDRKKKLDMAIYHLWLAREHAMPVEPVVLLCLPNEKADDVYKDKHCVFTFRLIKLWHLEAQEIVAAGQLSLYPLLPLMAEGASG
jgi:hypothetical protein